MRVWGKCSLCLMISQIHENSEITQCFTNWWLCQKMWLCSVLLQWFILTKTASNCVIFECIIWIFMAYLMIFWLLFLINDLMFIVLSFRFFHLRNNFFSNAHPSLVVRTLDTSKYVIVLNPDLGFNIRCSLNSASNGGHG